LKWYTNADMAVKSNLETRLPYLVLFYSPFARANNDLNRIITTDLAARKYLSRFVLVCIDVNQLRGGTTAQTFGIFKVPCFLMLDYNGNKISRVYFKENMSWNNIQQKLQPGYN